MRIKEVVIDSSPLIALFRSHQTQVLTHLFTSIWVPEAVWEEVTSEAHNDWATEGLVQATWVKRVSLSQIPEVISRRNLGRGETAVLSFALQHPSAYAMLDDLAARRCAKELGIATLGTGGMLVIAKQQGIISSVGESLRALRAAGLWLSEDLIEMLTTQAGEPLPGHKWRKYH